MTDGRFERNEKALLQPPADRWTEHGQTPVHIHQPKSHHIIVKIPSTIISSVEKKFLVVFLSLVLTASCSLPSATKQEASYKANCKRETSEVSLHTFSPFLFSLYNEDFLDYEQQPRDELLYGFVVDG